MPTAIDVAQLVSEGLSPEALRRRLLGRPQLCTHVSDDEMNALLRGRIGRYAAKRILLMKLVSNPLLYKVYSLATAKST